jgi:Domain of unknown function DUF11
MKTLALVIAVLVSASAFADANLVFSAVTPSKQTVATGERFTLTARIVNFGPDAAQNVRLQLGQSGSGFFLDIAAPAGWSCTPARYTSGSVCTIATLTPSAEATFTATVAAPSQAGDYVLGGNVLATTRDGNAGNNGRNVVVAVTPASRQTDLAVDMDQQLRVDEGADVQHRVTIRNFGPDEAHNVATVVHFTNALPITASGAGWTCETLAAERVVCTRAMLAAGASAPIDLRFTAPDEERVMSLYVTATAELSYDRTLSDGSAVIYVGSPASWRMMLVPIVASGIPGANGSLWNTDLRMLVRSDNKVEIRPHGCETSPIPECFPADPPLRTEFDPRELEMVIDYEGFLGQFIYVRAADFDKVHMNARVYDESRKTETAGAEIPIPRDTDFTSATIALLNIPFAAQYRHTLRIYDAGGIEGTRAIVRLYANDETEPRVTHVQTLFVEGSWRITTAGLPSHPAVAQLDLGQLLPLAGLRSVRVEIEPADPGARLWAFVSITNNDTHHVTTVTPQ